jgi:Mor family transcriptional regulator
VGRPALDEELEKNILADCEAGIKKTEIAEKYGIERKTIYNILKRNKK